MSKLTLQNLLEYGSSSYIIDYNYKYNLIEEIKKLKQSTLNEKAVLFKYDFIELNYFYKNPYEEMVFVFPINSTEKWFQFINSFLIIHENNYLQHNNYERQNIINSYYDLLTNKNENNKNYNEFIKEYKYNLIIIKDDTGNKDNNLEIFDNNFDKYIIMISYENEYYPLYNLLTKHFKDTSNIVELLLTNKNKNTIKNEKDKNEKDKNEKDRNDKDKNEKDKYEKDEYLELQTNDECELSLTELDEKKTILTKFSKDIFIPHKNTSNTDTNINKSNDSDSKKKDLIKNTKITLSIKQLQDIATELNISLTSGNLKNGNPKFRTKQELFEDIKNCKL